MKTRLIFKKVLKIVSNVVCYGFIALCLVLVVASYKMKKDVDRTLTVFGYQARIVQSDSMEKCEATDVSDYEIKSIRVKSLVFIQTVPVDEEEAEEWFADLKVGDVLTFRYVYNGQITITHRIVEIQEKPTGGRLLILEGDNKNASGQLMKQTLDTSLHFDLTNYNYTIGKVTGQSWLLGLLIYAVNSTMGMLFIVVVPCLIVIVMEVVKLISVFHKDKNEKILVEKQEQEAEIARLKSELAALQSKKENHEQVMDEDEGGEV